MVEWLQEACHDVTIQLPHTTNCSNYARGFWGRQQGTSVGIRVSHPSASSYHQAQVVLLFCNVCFVNMEIMIAMLIVDLSIPLVFSTSGGLGKVLYPRSIVLAM